jgi:beta-mannanase
MQKSYRKYLIPATLIALALIIWLIVPVVKAYFFNDCVPQPQEPVVGVFNRTERQDGLNVKSIQHFLVVWKNTAHWSDTKLLQKAMVNHDVLITLQTWLKGESWRQNVLDRTLQGTFDKDITELAHLVTSSKHTVLVRWDPEMEVPAYVYPWQFQSPGLYINAFNYFAQKLKRSAPNVKIVWGPAGFPGDTEFWPGNKLVDYVSITLGSASEYSTNAYPFAKTIPEMLKQKLHRMRFIDKPVLILGTAKINSTNFNQQWLADLHTYMSKYQTTIYSPANYVDTGKLKPVRKDLVIGVFDPKMKLLNQPEISVEHIFTDMGEVQRGNFGKSFKQIVGRHHDVIVTVEPWKDTSGKADTNVTKSIVAGRYDGEMRTLFRIFSQTKQTVYLRWMHEMEIPIHRYAWQSKDPVDYINAYRYFMQFEGGPPKNVKKVWGPAGDRGSIDFWPGDDVVDFISIAIYGLPDKNITDPNKQEAFSTIFNRKFYRMRFADKPIFITEFGVKGSEAYQDNWLKNAAETIKNNRHVFGICYFNLYDDDKAWGSIKPPDWSITPQSMKKFSNEVKGH